MLKLIYTGTEEEHANFVFRLYVILIIVIYFSLNILAQDYITKDNLRIFLIHSTMQRFVTKNMDCHDHSKFDLNELRRHLNQKFQLQSNADQLGGK